MITASWLDYIVIVLYFVGILYIGTLFSRFTKSTSDFFFGGLISYFSEAAQPVLEAIGYTFISWLFLYFLYRQKIFLRV